MIVHTPWSVNRNDLMRFVGFRRHRLAQHQGPLDTARCKAGGGGNAASEEGKSMYTALSALNRAWKPLRPNRFQALFDWESTTVRRELTKYFGLLPLPTLRCNHDESKVSC